MPVRSETAGAQWIHLFVPIGLLSIVTVAVVTPPFQVSDEIAHVYRADLVARGKIVGLRRADESGGFVDHSLFGIVSPFFPLIFHPEIKATDAAFRIADAVTWDGQLSYAKFENTSIYPPFLYAGAATALTLGKALQLSVLSSFYLARLTNGLLAVAFGWAALRLASRGAPWLFTMLLLPMTVAQMGSVSQDALTLPIAAVAAALFTRLSDAERPRALEFGLLCLALCLVATARVAYIPLALLPLGLRGIDLRIRILGSLAIVGSVVGWSLVAAYFALVPFGLPGADATAQVHQLLADPLRIFPIVTETFRLQASLYLQSFIGDLGWLDTPLPSWYYAASVACVAASAATLLPPVSGGGRVRLNTIVLAALLASFGAVFAALYITWTPVGDRIVEGVQGRYFMPLAMFLPSLITPRADAVPRSCEHRLRPLRSVLESIVVLYCALSLPIMVVTLVWRYYLG